MIVLNNLKSIVALLVGAILVFLFMKNCSGNKDSNNIQVSTPDKVVVVKLTTKLDTIYVKRYIHVIDTVKIPTYIKADTVFIKGTKDVATIPAIKRTYVDTVTPVDSVSVKYTAQTTGTLDNIVLEYKDRRAEKTILKVITKDSTATITKHPGGLFIGIGSNLGLTELSPHIQYVNGKNIFGIKYNIAGTQTPLQNVGITYSRKLF